MATYNYDPTRALKIRAWAEVPTEEGFLDLDELKVEMLTDQYEVVSADGAIAVPDKNTTYFITKAGVAAMTLVDPTATTHDGLRLTFISATAQAHTLSNAAGSGFNGAGAGGDVGTFGGAKGDGITIVAYQGDWYVIATRNVTLA